MFRDVTNDEWLALEHWSIGALESIRHCRAGVLEPLSKVPLLNERVAGLFGRSVQDDGRGKSSLIRLLEGDKSEPVEGTVDRATAALNGAALLVPQLEGFAVGANIVDLVDDLVPDTASEVMVSSLILSPISHYGSWRTSRGR